MGLLKSQTVLDVGCGVGAPARELARLAGVNVVGLNCNDYQLQRAARYTAAESLEDQVSFVKGDFMQMFFDNASFDAAFSIEGTSYAPELARAYAEVFKVLKPGARFAVYEMVMTDDYDHGNPEHRRLRYGLEKGIGMTNLVKASDAILAMKTAGFEVIEAQDLACRSDGIPWYMPYKCSFWRWNSVWDFGIITTSLFWRSYAARVAVAIGQAVGILPPGYLNLLKLLQDGACATVEAGEKRLFTPLLFILAQKPI